MLGQQAQGPNIFARHPHFIGNLEQPVGARITIAVLRMAQAGNLPARRLELFQAGNDGSPQIDAIGIGPVQRRFAMAAGHFRAAGNHAAHAQ